jgi:hypothetical protein
MSDDIFKKWGEDWKKGFNKFQQDFNNFFNITPKKSNNNNEEKISEEEEMSSESEDTNIKSDGSLQTSSNNASLENWNNFIQTSQNTLQQWQDEWNNNYKKFQERTKRSNEKTKEKLAEANTQMKQFFENQQIQMDTFFKKASADIQLKNAQNREKMAQNLQSMSQNWSGFVNKQAKQFEQSMTGWNKWVWKAQLQFVIWLIPVIILFVVIFSIVRYFMPNLML